MSGYVLHRGSRYDVKFYGPYREIEVRLKDKLVITVTTGHFYDYQFTKAFGGHHGIVDKNPKIYHSNAIDIIDRLIRKFCS